MNYLARLVARAASPQRAIAPRLPSRFEAATIDNAPPPEPAAETIAAPPPISQTTTQQRIVETEQVIRRQVQNEEAVAGPRVVQESPIRIERIESQREVHTKEIEPASAAPPRIERETRVERTNEKEIIIRWTHGETLRDVREVPGERIVEKPLAPPPPPEPRVVIERIMRAAPPESSPPRGERTLRPFRAEATSAPLPETTPTIHVTIGRVDVRAVMPAASQPRAESAPKTPALSLDDYLAQRKGGSR